MSSSTAVANMIIRAGRAFRAAEGKDPEIEGADLADWLLSDAEITKGDREMLAELVTGQWRRKTKASSAVGSQRVQEILAYYHERVGEYGPRQKKNAKADTIARFGIKLRRLNDYIRDERKRAKDVQAAKEKVQKSK